MVLESLTLPPQVTGSVKDGLLTLKSKGVSAHCMTPEKGFNAVACLLETLYQLRDRFAYGACMGKFSSGVGHGLCRRKIRMRYGR